MRTRILLADDSKIVRTMLKNLLVDRNPAWEISEAENGHETLQKIQAIHPEAVLLDLNLPDMPGSQVASQIRQASPSTKIIFCSFSDSTQLAFMAQKAGVDGYVMKGSSADEMSDTILSVLDAKPGRGCS
jgi:DNA-binding NarL/FixJ family response regulator